MDFDPFASISNTMSKNTMVVSLILAGKTIINDKKNTLRRIITDPGNEDGNGVGIVPRRNVKFPE